MPNITVKGDQRNHTVLNFDVLFFRPTSFHSSVALLAFEAASLPSDNLDRDPD